MIDWLKEFFHIPVAMVILPLSIIAMKRMAQEFLEGES